MRQRLCKHIGPVTIRQGTSKGGNRRVCSLAVITPDTGHRRECQTCEQYEPRDVAPAAKLQERQKTSREACRFLGRILTDDEKADRDLYQLRDWRFCEHPTKPLGEAVCGCRGCGKKCSGYKAED